MGHSYLYCSALLLGHLLALDVEGLGADLLGHLNINIVIIILYHYNAPCSMFCDSCSFGQGPGCSWAWGLRSSALHRPAENMTGIINKNIGENNQLKILKHAASNK